MDLRAEKWFLKPFETIEGITEVWMYDEIYRIYVHLLTDCGEDKLSRWMARVMNIKDSENHDKNLAGCCIKITNPNGGLIGLVITTPFKWEGKFEDIVTLFHECYHVASYTLFSRGLKHTSETEEAFCYFHESLVRRLHNAMLIKPVKYSQWKTKRKSKK